MNRSTEGFCGIALFTWADFDVIDEFTNQYYNVEFPFESMRQYNGMTVCYTTIGELSIYDESDNLVYDEWIMEIPELREELYKKFGGTNE